MLLLYLFILAKNVDFSYTLSHFLALSQFIDAEPLKGRGGQIPLRKDSATLPKYYVVVSASFQSFLPIVLNSKTDSSLANILEMVVWPSWSILGGQYSVLQDAGHPGGCTAVMLLRLTPGAPVTTTFSWPHQGLWVSTVHLSSPSYQFSWEHWCYPTQWYKKREASN